jgi:glycosyltransferase involved in cell wall biosynthesis
MAGKPGIMTAPRNLRPVPLEPLTASPLVSVLMPVHNYAAYLAKAIRSVLEQTYEVFELIVCDDGSTDNSLEIARVFAGQDSRVRIVEKSNGGHASALNAAWLESRGEIICLLDPDDLYTPVKLERVVGRFLERPQVGLIVHSMVIIDEEAKPADTIPFLGRFEEGWIAPKILDRGGRWRFMPSSGLCFRRDAAVDCMPIPEQEFRCNAESFLFTILPLFTGVSFIQEVLSCYRIHGANMTGEFAVNLKTLRYRQECLNLPNRTVNERLRRMGFSERLDLDRNLDLEILRLEIRMLAGENWNDLFAHYRHVMGMVLRDDIYGPLDKFLIVLSHAIALVLNLPARQWLLNHLVSPSPIKRRVQRIMRSGMLGSGARLGSIALANLTPERPLPQSGLPGQNSGL